MDAWPKKSPIVEWLNKKNAFHFLAGFRLFVNRRDLVEEVTSDIRQCPALEGFQERSPLGASGEV